MEKITIGNRTYRLLDACTVGDYGGDGTVGAANIRSLQEQFSQSVCRMSFSDFTIDGEPRAIYHAGCWIANPIEADFDLLILYGSYSSESAYLAEDCDQYADIVASLADYPCLEDEAVSEIEAEWLNAAVPDAVRDVGRAMRQHGELYEQIWDALDQEQAENAIHEALRNGTGGEVHYELSSAYIDADAVAALIVKAWGDLIEHRAVKLPDGTLVDLGEAETDETPYENGRVDSDFIGLPSDTHAYIAAFSQRMHHKVA